MNNLAGTMLEQMVVAKGGCACVMGGVADSIPWGCRVADFLLSKVVTGQRYKNIICLALDKSVQDIHAITRAPNGKVVTVVQRMRVEGGAAVRRDISEVLCETIDALSEGAASGATALVVYSLSEVIAAAGEECALNWLEVLATAAASTPAQDVKDAKTAGSASKKVLVLSVVHTSLHSPETLARIEGLCQTVSFVSPAAEGLMSTTGNKVVAEARTVRRAHVGATTSSSRSSGRTDFGRPGEGLDLFAVGSKMDNAKASGVSLPGGTVAGKFDRVLVPCAAVRNKTGSDGMKKTSGVRQVPSRAAADTGVKKIEVEDSSGASSINELKRLAIEGESEQSQTAANKQNNSTASKSKKTGTDEPKRLLVTYDNNDPEFDEDSDPDGDLEF